jgi:hypothetical protein
VWGGGEREREGERERGSERERERERMREREERERKRGNAADMTLWVVAPCLGILVSGIAIGAATHVEIANTDFCCVNLSSCHRR